MAAERAPDFDFGRRIEHAPAPRVGTDDLHSARLPPEQEAAVLFSANRASAAAACLAAQLRGPPLREEQGAWRMLLELHQLEGRRADFESVAALCAARFGGHLPEWDERATAAAREATLASERTVLVLDSAQPGGLMAQVEPLFAAATRRSTLLLSFEKVVRLGSAEAGRLAAALTALRRKGVGLTILESDVFEARLQLTAQRDDEASGPFWALLFELLVLQRKRADFDEMAQRRAASRAIAPPAWEEYRPAVDPRTGEAAFALQGVIGPDSLRQLQELRRHSLARPAIAVDFTRVVRIDYSVMSELIDTAQALHATGKQVAFVHLSELNTALLRAFDVDRLASLSR